MTKRALISSIAAAFALSALAAPATAGSGSVDRDWLLWQLSMGDGTPEGNPAGGTAAAKGSAQAQSGESSKERISVTTREFFRMLSVSDGTSDGAPFN